MKNKNKNINTDFICGSEKNCPSGVNEQGCPMHKFKKMSMDEIIKYLENAGSNEIEMMLLYKQKCDEL